MSTFNYSKYKILIDTKSKKTQGLRIGDVVRRQYVDNPNLIYSLMIVLETGIDIIYPYNIVDKSPAGTVKRTKSDEKKYSQEKDVKVKYGMDAKLLRDLANDLQNKSNYAGYQGSITCFLEPIIQKSCVVDVADRTFTDRTGLFFAEAIEGSFDQNGGRQKVTLGYFGFMENEINK